MATLYYDNDIDDSPLRESQIADMDKMAERIRQRSLDPASPPEYPRHIEKFRVINLR